MSIADQVAVMRDGRFTKLGSPEEVYRNPGDRFTAQFLGDCVLLPATVSAGVAQCAIGHVPVRGTAPSTEGMLMLRPEQIVARTVGDGDEHSGVATVLASEFRGQDVLLTVDPGGSCAPFVVRQYSIDAPAVRAKVRLEVIGHGVVLDGTEPTPDVEDDVLAAEYVD